MKIGEAIEAAIGGARITAPGWNGKDMWFAVEAGDVPAGRPAPPLLPVYTGPGLGEARPYLYLHDAQGHRVPWLPSMSDLFRDDYELAPGFCGEPVRAWGLTALAIAKTEGLVLTGSGPPDDNFEYDGDSYSDDAGYDWTWARWIYLPA